MLNAKPHVATRAIDGETVTLVFYPDTGCLRISDVRGTCHELRPPHSWFAISSASRGGRHGTLSIAEGLSRLLYDFCTKRSQQKRASAGLPFIAGAAAQVRQG